MNIVLNGQPFEGLLISPSDAQDNEIPQKGKLFGGNSWYGLTSYPEFEALTEINFEGVTYACELAHETITVGGSWYLWWNGCWWKLTEKTRSLRLMQVTVTYFNGEEMTTKTGYIQGESANDCLQKAMNSVKSYAAPSVNKIEATGTFDYPGYWTNELQPPNFWEDPTAKRFAGPKRPHS